MQHGENCAALARAERAGRGTPRRRSALGPPPAVVGRARQPERRTRGGDAQPRSDLGDRCHHEGSVVTGVPSNAATCFCRATRASARSARFCHRLISRACSASFLSRGSTTRRAGPRGFAAPASSPRSAAARNVVRCEEYSPSRRNNAPTAPGVLQPSASRTIFRLYSTVNRRRVALATTSIAGPPRACSNALIALRSCLALDTKLPGGHCLTHIGRAGSAGAGSGGFSGLRGGSSATGAGSRGGRARGLLSARHLRCPQGRRDRLSRIAAGGAGAHDHHRLAARGWVGPGPAIPPRGERHRASDTHTPAPPRIGSSRHVAAAASVDGGDIVGPVL